MAPGVPAMSPLPLILEPGRRQESRSARHLSWSSGCLAPVRRRQFVIFAARSLRRRCVRVTSRLPSPVSVMKPERICRYMSYGTYIYTEDVRSTYDTFEVVPRNATRKLVLDRNELHDTSLVRDDVLTIPIPIPARTLGHRRWCLVFVTQLYSISHTYHSHFIRTFCGSPALVAIRAKTVMIVDTSNEIAGDGDTPHRAAIGESRRIMVPNKKEQHR